MGLIGLYALIILAAGKFSGSIALAFPIGLVAIMWGVPLGISTVNGGRWPLILFLVFMMAFMDGSFRTRNCLDQSIDWQVMAKLGSWLAAGGIAALNLPRILPLLRQPHIALATAFVTLYPVSAIWAADPFYALSSGVFHLCVFGFALTVSTLLGERWAIIGLAIAAGALVLPSLAISPFTTSFAGVGACNTGELDRVRGFTSHPVALASLACKFAICVVYMMERRWMPRVWGIALLLAVAAIAVVTQSRVPPMALIVALTLSFVITRRIFGIASQFVLLPLTLLILAILLLGVDYIISEDVLKMVSRSGRPEEILTLSGRSEIWAFVLSYVKLQPILGYGQGAGPAILLTGFKGWALVHAHSMYFQALLCFGLVGLSLLIAVLVLQLQLAVASGQTFALNVVLYSCLLGVTEVSLVYNLPDSNFFFWCMAVALTLPQAGKADGPEMAESPADLEPEPEPEAGPAPAR